MQAGFRALSHSKKRHCNAQIKYSAAIARLATEADFPSSSQRYVGRCSSCSMLRGDGDCGCGDSGGCDGCDGCDGGGGSGGGGGGGGGCGNGGGDDAGCDTCGCYGGGCDSSGL